MHRLKLSHSPTSLDCYGKQIMSAKAAFGGMRKRSFISTIVESTVHTKPPRKRSFPKTLLKPEEIENFRVDRKHFENCVFKFLRRKVDEKHLMRFQP